MKYGCRLASIRTHFSVCCQRAYQHQLNITWAKSHTVPLLSWIFL